tara:strand:- start:7667 stop:8692 length:1026 start_codon:yes stop_codon:yes gene_type:complete
MLKEEEIPQFIQNGFILEDPKSNQVVVAVCNEGDPHQHKGFLLNFYGEIKSLTFQSISFMPREEFKSFIQRICPHKAELSFIRDGDDDYKNDVKTTLSWLQEKKLQKIVPTSFAHYNIKEGHPLGFLPKLMDLNGYVFGYWDQEEGMMGVTPEVLLYQENNLFETMALAGTFDTNQKNFASLLEKSNKNQSEQDFVCMDIEHKLKDHCTQFHKHEKEVFNFGPLAHLHTKITFESKENFLSLCQRLSPTAALGGFPTTTALKLLKDLNYFSLEKQSRTFGGAIGIELQDKAFSLVAIRSIEWKKNNLYIHSGTGVISASDIGQEWAEIKNKRKAIVEKLQV